MTDSEAPKTWDGNPISGDPPHGATIVIYRLAGESAEYLILHRSHTGQDDTGAWVWTPPSGARYPGEQIEDCARRELKEETGLVLDLICIDRNNEDWLVFAARLETDVQIRLSNEHDRYRWVLYEEALEACRPDQVAEAFVRTAQALKLR